MKRLTKVAICLCCDRRGPPTIGHGHTNEASGHALALAGLVSLGAPFPGAGRAVKLHAARAIGGCADGQLVVVECDY